jgi:hypothetical protein
MSNTRFAIACAGVIAAFASTSALAVDQASIEREVAGMNESLPAMVSPVLREEKVRFNGAELAYTFTRVGPATGAVSSEQVAAGARSYLLTRLCDDPDTRQMMHDGVVFSFGYVNEAGVDANRLLINESDCAVLVQPGR